MKTQVENMHQKISVLMDLEEWIECINILTDTKNKIVFDYQLFWDLGWCYYKLEKFDKSIFNFKSALKACPDKNKEKSICFGFLGISQLAIENFDEALELYKIKK